VDEARPIRIALDPELKAARGPELTWTWRHILTAAGRPWLEVALGEQADIAHVRAGHDRPEAQLVVHADVERWRAPEALRVRRAVDRDGWTWLEYDGESANGAGAGGANVSDGRTVVPHDVVFDLFWLATAHGEDRWARDKHGKPEPDADFVAAGLPRRAVGSAVANAIEAALERALGRPGVPRWPDGKRAAACLTHDVDYPEIVRWLEPLRVLQRRGPRGLRAAAEVALGRRTTWQFASWLREEQRCGARSAFYFVARKGSLREFATSVPDSFYDIASPRFRELFRWLDGEGAEIGLHSSYRAFESPERFAGEKAKLEECAQRAVVGNRHHYLHLDPERPEDTLALHEELGFAYDSTLGYERHLGWRNGLAWPFQPFHRERRREIGTLQIPFAWMDSHVFLYQRENPGDRATLLEGLAAHAVDQRGCFVINVHDYVYDDALFPGWGPTYVELVEHVAASGDFWIETPEVVARHWSARADALARTSQGLGLEPDLVAVG
jgi:hypothetical protein